MDSDGHDSDQDRQRGQPGLKRWLAWASLVVGIFALIFLDVLGVLANLLHSIQLKN